jgi:hypothetical protein
MAAAGDGKVDKKHEESAVAFVLYTTPQVLGCSTVRVVRFPTSPDHPNKESIASYYDTLLSKQSVVWTIKEGKFIPKRIRISDVYVEKTGEAPSNLKGKNQIGYEASLLCVHPHFNPLEHAMTLHMEPTTLYFEADDRDGYERTYDCGIAISMASDSCTPKKAVVRVISVRRVESDATSNPNA